MIYVNLANNTSLISCSRYINWTGIITPLNLKTLWKEGMELFYAYEVWEASYYNNPAKMFLILFISVILVVSCIYIKKLKYKNYQILQKNQITWVITILIVFSVVFFFSPYKPNHFASFFFFLKLAPFLYILLKTSHLSYL